jgi:hypothetical protein
MLKNPNVQNVCYSNTDEIMETVNIIPMGLLMNIYSGNYMNKYKKMGLIISE